MELKRRQKLLLWGIAVLLALGFLLDGASLATPFLRVLRAMLPIPLGLGIAFVLSFPLRFLERLWVRLFADRALRVRRPVCLVLCLLLAIGLIALIGVTVIPRLVRSVVGVIERLPEYSARAEAWWGKLSQWLAHFSIALPPLALEPENLQEMLSRYLAEHGSLLLNFSIDFLRSTFSAVWDGMIATVLAIYILAQKERLARQIRRLITACFSERTTERIFHFVHLSAHVFSRFLIGQVSEAIILGALCFVGMLIFGFPYALLISVLIGVSALIPIFGALIGTGVGAVLIFLDDPFRALWFVLFILVLQQIEGNLIYPRVVGKSVGLSGLWVLIAVTVGSAFGVLGMLLAVPIFSIAYTLLRRFVESREAKKE